MEFQSIGKYRKTKAYGLVGCLSFMMFGSMLALSPIQGIGLETVHASVVNGGSDIKDADITSPDNSGVAMTYTTYESGTSGKQTASGSGVFVAPNVVVTVAHNYLDKNKETNEGFVRGGDSAQSYVVINSSTEKVNKNPSTGESQLVNKGDIHYYNEKELGSSYTNDLAVTVLDKPIEAMTDGNDSARNIGTAEKGDDIRLVGYPNDFSSKNISDTNRERLKDGKLYEVRGTLSELNTSTGEGTYHMSALGGFSGGPIFNDKGDVVGIHQHGTNSDATPENQQHGGGLFFTDKHKAWINSMIDKYAIKGWYVDGDKKYYYDENHKPLKNVDKDIDGARYHFDEKGHAKLLSGTEKGQLVLKAFDKKGEKLFERVLSKGNVGEAASYNFKSDKENEAFFSKNPNATVVSIDEETINKKFNESWSKVFESKYKLGDTVIKTVIDGVTDFNRTANGKVDTSGKVNLPKLTDEIRRELNGETNFGATGRIMTPDGSGSGTLISEDTILTVAHNFLKFENGKVTEKAKGSGDKYTFTLTNGKTVRFSDADIHYWKRDDSVVGFTHDLAVIKLKNKIEDVKPANLVSTTPHAQNGDKVSVFGFPDGKFGTVLNTPITDVVDRQNGLTGVSYMGTKPGASGGGLYNANGDIIGVHQNGVVNSRSGGLVFSKEQFDWVKSYVDGIPKEPVYRNDSDRIDDKDKKTTSVEFKENRIRINNEYELSREPYLIVKETPDMKIDEDPGLVKALADVKGDSKEVEQTRKDIRDLMSRKTGAVFKVRSYEKDGKEGWRYFRTYTPYDVNSYDHAGVTKIPFVPYVADDDLFHKDLKYVSNDQLDYGKAEATGVAYESDGNMTDIVWTHHEPAMEGEQPLPNGPDFNVNDGKKANQYERYEGDTSKRKDEGNSTINGDSISSIQIGTKSVVSEEIVEQYKTKYVMNRDLDVPERVLQEGSNKIKKTKTMYALKKLKDARHDVKVEVPKIDEIFTVPKSVKLIPTVENGGVEMSTDVSYTELKDKIIEKPVPKDTSIENKISHKVIYEKDDSREKGQPDIRVEGEDGFTTTITTYSIDENTGEVLSKTIEGPKKSAKDTIVKVAAKTKVDIIRTGDKVTKRTTVYDVDKDIGKITEKVTEEELLIDKPPVLDIPEYKGLIDGAGLDGNGGIIPPPVVEGMEFNGGVNGDPLVNEKDDYKGVLAGNGLDGNGGVIEPPVVEIPEYKGSIGINPTDAPKVDIPEYKGIFAGNGLDGNGGVIEPPVVNIPEFKGGTVSNEAPIYEKPAFDLSKLRNPYLGTGLNDFGPKKETNESDIQFIPVKDEKQLTKVEENPTVLEKPLQEVSLRATQLPNTAGGNNMAINTLGALTLASVLGFVVTKRKSENE